MVVERAPLLPLHHSRFTKDTGIIASYAMTAYPASAYLWLRDFDTARTRGEAALAAIERSDV